MFCVKTFIVRAHSSGVERPLGMRKAGGSNPPESMRENMKKELLLIFLLTVSFASPLLLIIDASGSMEDEIEGSNQTKIEAAKEAAINLINKYNDEIALMVYTDCDDEGDPMTGSLRIEEEFTTDKSTLINKVKDIEPFLGTPLVDSIKEGIKYLKSRNVHNAQIVVLTDGEDTCSDEDLQTVIEEALSSGYVVNVAIVGFGLEEDTEKEIRREVTAAGGKYYSAQDAITLKQSLEKAAGADNQTCCCLPALMLLLGIGAAAKP